MYMYIKEWFYKEHCSVYQVLRALREPLNKYYFMDLFLSIIIVDIMNEVRLRGFFSLVKINDDNA